MDRKNEKFRILLLSVSSTSFFYEQVVMPFGLASLASFVDCPDYQIKGIELNWPAEKIMQRYLKIDDEILEQILDFSPKHGSFYSFNGVVYNESIDDFVKDFPRKSFDDYKLDAKNRDEYIKKFLGYPDFRSSERIYNYLNQRLSCV